MIDGHIHFHGQVYSLSLIEKMIEVAQSKGIDELFLLDHTHKFYEFDFLYTSLKEELTCKWFYNTETKIKAHLQEYIDFIQEVRRHEWPIKLHFGLEVCYFKDKMEEFKKALKSLEPFKFDFLIGSIHYVDSIAVDLCKEVYEKLDIDHFYRQYFEDIIDMINSKMFTFIAHPDLYKLYAPEPPFDLTPFLEKLCQTLKDNNQETENNSGLIRYGFAYPGLSSQLLEMFDKYKIRYHRSSDAHDYKDIGRVFNELKSSVD